MWQGRRPNLLLTGAVRCPAPVRVCILRACDREVVGTVRPVQMVNLTEAVTQEILDQVRNGVLQPGDRLPGEKTLMQQLGVSRPVLREALRSLAAMNVISIRPGYGAVVCDVQRVGMINADLLTLVLERGQELRQLHEARVVLEVALPGGRPSGPPTRTRSAWKRVSSVSVRPSTRRRRPFPPGSSTRRSHGPATTPSCPR